jgi:four helix bundle protein
MQVASGQWPVAGENRRSVCLGRRQVAVQHYRELIVWQKAMNLVEAVYRMTDEFPKKEIYGLASQIQRAAVSVPSNIAEGQGRSSTREFLHFLSMAQGSLMEVETQITIAERL